jgi:hypothetical protein
MAIRLAVMIRMRHHQKTGLSGGAASGQELTNHPVYFIQYWLHRVDSHCEHGAFRERY